MDHERGGAWSRGSGLPSGRGDRVGVVLPVLIGGATALCARLLDLSFVASLVAAVILGSAAGLAYALVRWGLRERDVRRAAAQELASRADVADPDRRSGPGHSP